MRRTGARLRQGRPLVGVVVTGLVAASTYSGAVTLHALAAYVLPGVLACSLLAARLARKAPAWQAALLAGAVALVWAQVVNVAGGETNGPIARSTFLAAAGAVLATTVVRTRAPAAALLVPVAGIVVGALWLGAAGEVGLLVVLTVCCSVLTVAAQERSRRRWVTTRPARWLVPAVALALAGAAAAVVVVQHRDQVQPAVVFQTAQTETTIVAPPLAQALQGGGVASDPDDPVSPPSTHPAAGRPPAEDTARDRRLLLLVVLAVVAGTTTLSLAAQWTRSRLAWRVRRRVLKQHDGGAWTWACLSLAEAGTPLPASLSPDRVQAGEDPVLLGEQVLDPLVQLAGLTVPLVFAPPGSAGAEPSDRAWALADLVAGRSRASLTRRRRLARAFRLPPGGPAGVDGGRVHGAPRGRRGRHRPGTRGDPRLE